jgi:hypothetical protein
VDELQGSRGTTWQACYFGWGWLGGPSLSQVLNKKMATPFGLSAMLDTANHALSILNGGLGKISMLC